MKTLVKHPKHFFQDYFEIMDNVHTTKKDYILTKKNAA